MLVVVFQEESNALEAYQFLSELEVGPEVFAQAVIKKNVDGSVSIEESSNIFPFGEVRENRIDNLIDLLGDAPTAETGFGHTVEMDRAGVDADFLRKVSSDFVPGKFAVVSNIREDITAPVDNEMDKLGGHVFRMLRQNVTNEPKAQS